MTKSEFLDQINAFEKHYDYDSTYMRELLDSSVTGYDKFNQSMALVSHQELLDQQCHWAAKLTATKTADCGDCLQLGVKMALENGINKQLVNDILYQPNKLSSTLQDVCTFAEGVVQNTLDDQLQEKMARQFSKGQLLEFGIIISGAVMFPTIKRTLGYTKSCGLNKIAI